jgi:hemerythrin
MDHRQIQELGVPEVDQDHRRLLDLYHQMLEEPLASERRFDLVATLIDYATAHSVREEGVMRAMGYPQALRHELEHQRIQDALLAVIRPILRGERPQEDVAQFLETTFIEHVHGEDAEFAAFARVPRGGNAPLQSSTRSQAVIVR